jgi:uncharacterized membrane protein YphA (DoxX/SURF4 family)
MFPTGTAGAALLLFRVAVAATLVANVTAHGDRVISFWILLLLAVQTICLCLGLFTPYCAAASCLLQVYLAIATVRSNEFNMVVSVLNSGILAVLGPGSYSIDAVLFGRRRLILPARR